MLISVGTGKGFSRGDLERLGVLLAVDTIERGEAEADPAELVLSERLRRVWLHVLDELSGRDPADFEEVPG